MTQKAAHAPDATAPRITPFGQSVLVLQGGGALGAYQLGVYKGMHEVGMDPDWVVGTSIGAINGALIAGNVPEKRMERLQLFWDRMESSDVYPAKAMAAMFGNAFANFNTITRGIPGFFAPNLAALWGQNAVLGVERASYYTTDLLRETLNGLVDFEYLASGATRLTVGAVNARTGAMRYFDSRNETLGVEHIMASGALPPAFPAVRIDGEPYWDGGIYSNTPLEVVLDDNPRRDSTIFAVQLWSPEGPEPRTLTEIAGRQKDIQFSTRDNSHIQRQQQIHKLRHIIREMTQELPDTLRRKASMKELSAWGCGTTMHLVRLHAPRLDGEDQSKDIDFSSRGIREREKAGYADVRSAIAAAPWESAVDPKDGVLIHEVTRE